MLFKKYRRLLSLMLAAALTFSLTACGDSGDIAGLPEGFEDMSEEELQALVDSVVNGELTQETPETDNESSEEKGFSGGPIGQSRSENSEVPEIGLRIRTDYKYSDDYEKLLYKGGCQAPLVTARTQKQFPELAKALSGEAEESFSLYEETKDEYIKSAAEHYKEEPDFFDYGSYENSVSILLRRLDDTVFSYASGSDSYAGGAHGVYAETGHTFDVKTGKELVLKDVLPDVSGLNGVLKEKLLEKYDEEEFFDIDGGLEHYDADLTAYENEDEGEDYKVPYTWWLSPLGIEFYFGPYALTSYASGSQTVTIGYEEYPKAFSAEYVPKETGSFIYDFKMNTDVFDITGDGKEDNLSVFYEYDAEHGDFFHGVTGYLNDQKDSFDDDLWIYRADYTSHYIRLSDGSQYVYAEGFVDDDHKEFFVFDLNDKTIKAADNTVSLDYESGVLEEEEDYSQILMTDPENMQMETLFYLLSTFYGDRSYHVGADGMPEPNEERYIVRNLDIRNKLTSKKDLTCDIVDEEGNILSTEESIPSGETFSLYATDGETYVDAILSDGRIARLHLTGTEYPCYVDGVSAEDCFEELYYVG